MRFAVDPDSLQAPFAQGSGDIDNCHHSVLFVAQVTRGGAPSPGHGHRPLCEDDIAALNSPHEFGATNSRRSIKLLAHQWQHDIAHQYRFALNSIQNQDRGRTAFLFSIQRLATEFVCMLRNIEYYGNNSEHTNSLFGLPNKRTGSSRTQKLEIANTTDKQFDFVHDILRYQVG
jgi:hypothetical protein